MYVGMDPMRGTLSDACCDGRRSTTFLGCWKQQSKPDAQATQSVRCFLQPSLLSLVLEIIQLKLSCLLNYIDGTYFLFGAGSVFHSTKDFHPHPSLVIAISLWMC